MATITDTITQSWSGTGNGAALNTVTNVTGSNAEQVVTQIGANTVGQAVPFSMAIAAMQEVWIQSDQNIVLSGNMQFFTFTCTSANATLGAVYTNNGQTFTVLATISSGTTLLCTGIGAPTNSGTLTKSTGTGDSTITFSSVVAPNQPYYIFTCSSANATVGATFTNNGVTFTVLATIAAGTQLVCSALAGTVPLSTPLASGTLTKASGTGDSTITFSAVSYPNIVLAVEAGVPFVWLATGYYKNPFNADNTGLFFTNTNGSAANLNIRALRS